jgi:uncharacterized protein YcbK (DUF882 family)
LRNERSNSARSGHRFLKYPGPQDPIHPVADATGAGAAGMNRRRALLLMAGAIVLPRTARPMPVPPACRRLRLFNPHTGETFDGAFRDDREPIAEALNDLSIFLRDFHCGERIVMDVGVLDFLASLLDAIGEKEAIILSAYRTPATNAMLARTRFGVADNSQHMYGRALDVSFHGKLPEAMRIAREMRRGGVGWYPQSGFIHIDTGPVRNWDFDESGLDSLIANAYPAHFAKKADPSRERFYSRELQASGRPLPSLGQSGRSLPSLGRSSRL